MYAELSNFRVSHHLENSCGNVTANMFKELGELLVEIDRNDELKIIDELCDLVIFPINAMEAMGHDAQSNINRIAQDWNVTVKTAAIFTGNRLVNYIQTKDIKELAQIAAWCLVAIRTMDFSAELCVKEKAKCINSRNGSYDESQQKWCKDENQDKSTIYQPNYNSCRRGD